ncbi:MAG TPA: serine hydrolase domain-containing protein [bacterium]|nr:serine hydrolase domain-containing protein [bacterium]HQI47167.1 serine hydrolase domain-containing protein [bacterium]HQJ63534.1 serine hydrolase domain-containing protein [bacterium]
MKRYQVGGMLVLLGWSLALSQSLPARKGGVNMARLALIDKAVQLAIDRGDIPGAVVLVNHGGEKVLHKAYGNCQLVPDTLRMAPEMMFDLASVTKPVATATSIMILAERGQLRLTDRVSDYVPGFSRYRKPDSSLAEEARIWHLLTHTSGLPSYTSADKAAQTLGTPCTTAALVDYIAQLPKLSAPGELYTYSCLGFITLNRIIQAVSGQDVSAFAKENIFEPLGMRYTTFNPDETLRLICVPTEVQANGLPLRGVVHDPLARLQGGISGNAGLFSTASDLARYCQMMLNGGILGQSRILSPVTVARMTQVVDTPAHAARGYGWVIKQGQSWVGGDLLPDGGYGHTGYTGTSIWIDPKTRTYIIILSNRVHPKDDGEVDSMRSTIANIVASAIIE